MDRFSKDIQGDDEAIIMACPEFAGVHLASKLSKHYKKAADLCCGIGMTGIMLAKKMKFVHGLELNADRLMNAEYNAVLYGVESKVSFMKADVTNPTPLKYMNVDVAVLDPDWGNAHNGWDGYTPKLECTKPNLRQMFELTKEHLTENIVARIPKTFTPELMSELGDCTIENIIWDGRVRFKIAYFLDVMEPHKVYDIEFP